MSGRLRSRLERLERLERQPPAAAVPGICWDNLWLPPDRRVPDSFDWDALWRGSGERMTSVEDIERRIEEAGRLPCVPCVLRELPRASELPGNLPCETPHSRNGKS